MIFCGATVFFIESRLFSRCLQISDSQVTSVDSRALLKIAAPLSIYVESIIPSAQPFDHYDSMKMLSSLINNLIGHNFTCFLALICLYFATNLDELFSGTRQTGKTDYSKMIRSSLYHVNYACIMIFSAEICRQV